MYRSKTLVVVVLGCILTATGCGRSRIGELWARADGLGSDQQELQIKQTAATQETPDTPSDSKELAAESATPHVRDHLNAISAVFTRTSKDDGEPESLLGARKTRPPTTSKIGTESPSPGVGAKPAVAILMGSGSKKPEVTDNAAPKSGGTTDFGGPTSLLKRKDPVKGIREAPVEQAVPLIKSAAPGKFDSVMSGLRTDVSPTRTSVFRPATVARESAESTVKSKSDTAGVDSATSPSPLSFFALLDERSKEVASPSSLERASIEEYFAARGRPDSELVTAEQSTTPTGEAVESTSDTARDPWKLFRQPHTVAGVPASAKAKSKAAANQ